MDSVIVVEPLREGASAEELSRLSESFRTFNRVTRDLEAAYAGLKSRAERIDARLQETNAELSHKVLELRRTTDRLRATLDAAPCGVVTCDADGAVDGVNRAAERLLGRAADEIRGRDVRSLRSKDGAPLLLLGAPEGAPAERTLAACDGARRRVSSTTSVLPDGGRLEILTDLTEVAHLRTQLNRLDTLAALGEMAAGIAHEVRNPLNGVEGFAGLLARALAADASAERSQLLRYVDRIRRGVAEVDEIISNLLLWARPEKLARSAFSASALFEEVVAEAPRLAPADAALPTLELIGEDDGRPLVADRVKLRIVFTNLVKNSFEAAGPVGRVVVRFKRGSAGLEASVEDDGPGVAPEMRRRLFRPFSTDKASGTGLGLAIAKKLIECHGGELRLAEDATCGARFVANVPDASASVGVAS